MPAPLRWAGPMSPPGSIGPRRSTAIEDLVDEPIGLRVLLAADVTDRPAPELLQRPPHLGVQFAHRRVLDLVLAADLAHDQLRVADQLHLVGAELRRPPDPAQQRPVLCDGGGRRADAPPPL